MLKSDIINGAFSQLRISGLTLGASTEDLTLALETLEDLARELEASNICVGYAFEDEPDLNTPHNMERKFWAPFKTVLASRLLDDFGKADKPAAASLLRRAGGAYSFLAARTAPMKQVRRPTRHPIGAKIGPYQRFYKIVEEAPLGCTTNVMYIDDVEDFEESYAAWLKDGETISSYTIEADTGLTINSDSNTDTVVSYQIQADGSEIDIVNELLEVKIIVTSSDSRILTRIINFRLKSAEI